MPTELRDEGYTTGEPNKSTDLDVDQDTKGLELRVIRSTNNKEMKRKGEKTERERETPDCQVGCRPRILGRQMGDDKSATPALADGLHTVSATFHAVVCMYQRENGSLGHPTWGSGCKAVFGEGWHSRRLPLPIEASQGQFSQLATFPSTTSCLSDTIVSFQVG